MMKFLGSAVWLFFLSVSASVAQSDSLVLTKNFKFTDGVYASYADFQKNKPTYIWQDVNANLATSEEGFVAQVEYIRHDREDLDMQQVWGICLGGIPYIRLPKGEVTDAATVFAGLRVRGKICYFRYKDEETEYYEVKAYNPLNGRPYRQAKVPVEKTVEREFMLDWETGEIAEMTVSNMLDWIADDRQLWESYRELSREEAEDRLFRVLLIYDDRNLVYLKK
jgi:hypothetical protein